MIDTSNDEIVLLESPLHGQTELFKLKLKNMSLEKIKIDKLDHICGISFTKISPSVYFLYGGFNKLTQKIVRTSWLYNALENTSEILADGLISGCNFEMLSVSKKVYVVGGKEDPETNQYFSNLQIYDFEKNSWLEALKLPVKIKGIVRIIGFENKLRIFLYRNTFIDFDIEDLKWGTEIEFEYDFDYLFVRKNGDCLLINEFQRSFCTYNLKNDSIVIKKVFAENEEFSNVLFIRELDSVLFFNSNGDNKKLFIYDFYENKMLLLNDQMLSLFSQPKALFQTENNAYINFENIACNKIIEIQNEEKSDLLFIFGTNYFPFKISLNLKKPKESIKIQAVHRKLHLKNQQGVKLFDDNRLLFAGGFDSELSVEGTRNCYLYDPFKDLAHDFANCNEPCLGTNLHKLNLKQDSESQFVLKNQEGCFEIYWPNEKKWKECEPHEFDSDEISFLNEKNRLIVFWVDREKESTLIKFAEYLGTTNKWADIGKFEIEASTYFWIWSFKIKDNKFLVVRLFEKVWFLTILTLVFNTDSLIESVQFDKLCRIPLENCRGDRLQVIHFNDFLMFMFVNENWKLEFFFYDLNKKEEIKNELTNDIIRSIEEALRGLGIEENMQPTINFSLIVWNE